MHLRNLVGKRLAVVIGVAAVFVGLSPAAVAAADGSKSSTNLRPAPTVATPVAQPAPAVSTLDASGDGVWQINEIAMWRDSNFRSAIYDTTNSVMSAYAGLRFVNTALALNDHVSSVSNAQNGYRWMYQHANHAGATIVLLPYGQCNTTTCYSYSGLGWANDQLSSHADF